MKVYLVEIERVLDITQPGTGEIAAKEYIGATEDEVRKQIRAELDAWKLDNLDLEGGWEFSVTYVREAP